MDEPRYDGPNFRKIRQAAGIRMADLARTSGVSYGHLRMFEAGARNVSPEAAHRLSNGLATLTGRAVPVEEFLTSFRDAA